MKLYVSECLTRSLTRFKADTVSPTALVAEKYGFAVWGIGEHTTGSSTVPQFRNSGVTILVSNRNLLMTQRQQGQSGLVLPALTHPRNTTKCKVSQFEIVDCLLPSPPKTTICLCCKSRCCIFKCSALFQFQNPKLNAFKAVGR
jgi:hypothetical protein